MAIRHPKPPHQRRPPPPHAIVKNSSHLPSKTQKPPKAKRLRRSILDIQTDWENGKPQELESLIRAFEGIQKKHHDDEQSFFTLGGFHGAPFRGKGISDERYWGGYCQHGNYLFPVWHRAYVLAFEDALRSIEPTVTLPFLDQMGEYAQTKGIPWVLTNPKFTFKDGKEIDNPLYSFKLPVPIKDLTEGKGASHSKPKGYQTVRYPLSGLVGTEEDRKKTEAHNANFPDPTRNIAHLNANYVDFVNDTVVIDGKPFNSGVYQDYLDALEIASYHVFSNQTSAGDYNRLNAKNGLWAPNLESAHNSIHLAIGGFDNDTTRQFSPIDGANGDMGENDVAGLDPIFFFHHCFVDYVFWQWQKKHEATNPDHPAFKIDPSLGGKTSSDHSDTQGPPPDFGDNVPYNLDTPLYPFKNPHTGKVYTGRETINIYAEPMNYDYDKGPLASKVEKIPTYIQHVTDRKVLEVAGLDKTKIHGSFIIEAFAVIAGKRVKIGSQSILSRWNTKGCVNCQTHLIAVAHFSVPASVNDNEIAVRVRTRQNPPFEWNKKDEHPSHPPPGFEQFIFHVYHKK